MHRIDLRKFIEESNRIEGIHTPVSAEDIDRLRTFLKAPLTMQSLIDLQAYIAPGKPLRRELGMDVRVGQYVAPAGGPGIAVELGALLDTLRDAADEQVAKSPFETHCDFESLHPFMDGNGRTGRALWAWHMRAIGEDPFALGFLHAFYYQTLQFVEDATKGVGVRHASPGLPW